MENIWLVVPTYNEKNNLTELVERIFAQSPMFFLLVVDDNSPDGTGQLADELAQKYKGRMFVLHRSSKQGLGSAYRQGFAYCIDRGAKLVGEMDADLSHIPEDLPKLWDKIEQGAQVVIGSRRVRGGKIVGWGPWRHFISWGANIFSRVFLGLKTRDVTAGFRLYRVEALEKIPWRTITSNGYAWQEEIIFLLEKSGVRVQEVPVVFNDRSQGKSKLKGKDIFEFFKTIFRLRWQ